MSNKKTHSIEDVQEAILDSATKSVTKGISKYGIAFIVASVLLSAAACVLGLQFLRWSFNAGVNAAQISYESEKEEQYNEAYATQYQHAYDINEAKYHNSHDVSIRITDIQKISKLEVIKVVEEEVITQDASDDKKGIKAWYKVSGTGTFTVDLSNAEFITNDKLHYVKVMVFKPEMTDFNYNPSKKLFYADKSKTVFGIELDNGTYQEGFELYSRLRQKGYSAVRNAIANNQSYYLTAQSSAKTLIENLVKNMNADIKDLAVDVVYYEDIAEMN